MNVALILAGGVDKNFRMNIPKQFVNVENRPIIVYTLEAFQKHSDIDEIVVVCVDGWQAMVQAYCKQFEITKLSRIIAGGQSTQQSTYLGLKTIQPKMGKGDMVIVHDAIRPLVSEQLITSSIKMCSKKGMGVAATCIMDTIMNSEDGKSGYNSLGRYDIMKVQTPQAYDFELIWSLHNRAIEEMCLDAWDNTAMITALGEKVYFSEGSDFNLRINTVEDVAMFGALYRM